MQCFIDPLKEMAEFNEACKSVKKGDGPVLVTGLGDGVKANFAMALAKKTNARNKVFVTYSEQRARELKEDLQLYDKKAIIYPAKDLMFFAADVLVLCVIGAINTTVYAVV